GVGRVSKKGGPRRPVLLALRREIVGPVALNAVDVADDAAVLLRVRVRARAAFLREVTGSAGSGPGHLVRGIVIRIPARAPIAAAVAGVDVGSAVPTKRIDTEQQRHHERCHQPKPATADGHTASGGESTPAAIFDLGGVKIGPVLEL